MQITSYEIANTKYVQIYLRKEELESKETQEIIERYKKQRRNVGIFVTGKENYPEVLKKIVTKQVETNCNVC